jgi:UDP-glucose 4-epimerase
MKRILVTGGAGFIGSHLSHHLLAQGHAVTVLDDFSTGTLERLERAGPNDRLRVIEGSILNPDVVAAAVQNCEMVYHLAVQCVRRSIGKPIANHDINATGTLNMLESARRAKSASSIVPHQRSMATLRTDCWARMRSSASR